MITLNDQVKIHDGSATGNSEIMQPSTIERIIRILGRK